MKTFDIIKPSLEQLFNAQKARVYEFWLETIRYQRSRKNGGQSFTTIADLHNWTYYEDSTHWSGLGNPETSKKFKEAYKRVFVAKNRFEQAGGKYKNFTPTRIPHKSNWTSV